MDIARLLTMLLLLGIGVWVFDKVNGKVLGTLKGKLP